MSKYKEKGFTLIELLIVIGIIAILAAAVIVAINPAQQFAAARDATRSNHINSLHNSLISYQVANQGTWGDIDLPQELTEICNTEDTDPENCGDLIDLSPLVDEGYMNQIPVDPQAEGDGTGYLIAQSSVILVAENYETRFIGAGITETEYMGFCVTNGQGEHTINGSIVYCDSDNNMWAPTLNDAWTQDVDYSSSDNQLQWGCRGQEIGSSAQSSMEGNINTGAIISFHDDDTNFEHDGNYHDYYTYDGDYDDIGCYENNDGVVAAKVCNELIYAGYDDWYLPAIETVELLYNDCPDNQSEEEGECEPGYDNYAKSNNYWSSTESNNDFTMHMSFGSGFVGGVNKDYSSRARCVRR